MDGYAKPQQPEPNIRDLLPELTEEELKEAESNLRAYFEVALGMSASIDTAQNCPTIEERSKANLKT